MPSKEGWSKGLGSYSCLPQMNGCSPPSPLVALVCIQYPFKTKTPNIGTHSPALKKLAFWDLKTKQAFVTTADYF